MIRRTILTATLTILLPSLGIADETGGDWKKDLNTARQGAHGQHWRDAGKPWQNFGSEFKSVGKQVGQDFMTIGPATRDNFRGGPRWDWSADSGRGAPRGEVLYQDHYQSAAPAVQYQPVYQPQYQALQPTPLYVEPANSGLVYLPAEPQVQYVPQETYTAPQAAYSAAERAPSATPIPAYPTYEMKPVQ